MTATFLQSAGRAWAYVIAEPIRAALRMAPQTLITSASVYLIAGFGAAHGILPQGVAWAMAVGFEWTLLRGWATAAKLRGATPWEVWGLNSTAALTVIAYGILYIIGLPAVGIIPEPPGPAWGLGLAVAKVLPLALMTFFAMMLHRAGEVQKGEVEDEWDRKRRAVDLEVYEAEQKALARLRVRANAAESVPAASGTPVARSREHLREQVARTLREHPETNRAALARSLSIGRTTLYDLIKEAQARGEL